MKSVKFLLMSSLIATTLSAELVNLKEGWNLVGFGNATTVEKLKSENKSIKQVFIFKDEFIESGEIKPADGVWVYSDTKIEINLNEEGLSKDEIPNEVNRVDKIDLTIGWNLISLPVNSAISPKVFKDVNVIWKFSDGEWNHFGGGEALEYPKIDVIGSGEGFWINSKVDQSIYLSDEEAKLTNFNSEDEMDKYLSAMVNFNKSYRGNYIYPIYYTGALEDGVAPEPVPSATDTTTGESTNDSVKVDDATTTNLQEEGVDEADIVKHDGEKIFYLPSDWSTTEIYVNTFERVLAGESEKLTSIKLDAKPNELYLIDNKLIAIYPNNYDFWGSWESIDYSIWSESSKIEVYDVTNLDSITKVNEYKIDGNIVDSRVTNNKLYLVTRFMPYVEVEYPKIYVECKEYVVDENSTIRPEPEPMPVDEVATTTVSTTNSSEGVSTGSAVAVETNATDSEDIMVSEPEPIIVPYPDNNYCWYPKDDTGYYKLDYDNPILEKEYLKPSISDTLATTSRVIPTANTLYAPAKFDQASFITSITSFDIDNFANQESVSVVGGSSTIYASNKAIYVATQEYPIYFGWRDYKERTSIYKFSIDGGLSYNGKAFVDGRILNQFSLSEYNDILRIASTTGWSWRDETNNIVSTISESENELSVIGKLEGLGKEGETIKGVRFLGNRGFVVTFKQTDPLYTIDLSEPTNPTKVGELSISGYSSYFHPIDENRILSIGRDADEEGRNKGVQIELFDISDFANPTLADKVVIGEDWYTSTEAEYNHKAFTYRSSDNLFALPINQTISREMNESEKSEYYDTYYSKYDGKVETVVDEDGNTTDTEPSVDSTWYPQVYTYTNYLDIYQVDGLTIKSIDKIDGNNSGYNYNYQRGIIFTNNSIDYGLYIAGGEMFLKEITK